MRISDISNFYSANTNECEAQESYNDSRNVWDKF